ncbi:hypothetical protein F4823DRAFT_565413 [Ustulina deusta]|nr:hypothetical protein F4823DRAFT_565413 [Ustulina deusta]
MHSSTILGLFLAALAAAAPSPNNQGNDGTRTPAPVALVTSGPDCPSIKDYCLHCNDRAENSSEEALHGSPLREDDFTCETNPNCEWCFTNRQFDTSN